MLQFVFVNNIYNQSWNTKCFDFFGITLLLTLNKTSDLILKHLFIKLNAVHLTLLFERRGQSRVAAIKDRNGALIFAFELVKNGVPLRTSGFGARLESSD